jgi:hypothetical protein
MKTIKNFINWLNALLDDDSPKIKAMKEYAGKRNL